MATPHPLDLLSAEEISRARDILGAAGHVGEHTRFAYLGLREPHKSEVLSHRPGDAVDRVVRAFLVDVATGRLEDVEVSLTMGAVLAAKVVDGAADGQFPILDGDFARAEEIVHADEGWRAAMARRGLTDVSKIRACPLTAGRYGDPDEDARRLVRVLAFHQADEHDVPWAHPIDGVAAYVDLVEGRVIKLVDERLMPVPAESGSLEPAAYRTTLKPIEISQPEGVSFSLTGNLLEWEKWSLRVGFDAREGLTLHQIAFDDDGRRRPVVYRASVAEMVIPYGDPGPTRYWQNYFDSGEYLVGKFANSLTLGCDCLGEIVYLDAVIADDLGAPRTIRNAVCIHEEDYGILWKHTEIFTGKADTRRQRRLVISFFTTVGNYDYGFYWYLYLDGTIELEVKATGVVFTSAHPHPGYPHATEVAPGLGAPSHQHLFGARLDMTVDGLVNAVDEIDVERAPLGPDNPYGNVIGRRVTRLTTELDGARRAAADRGRVWRVSNPGATNRFGEPVAYVLHPQQQPMLLADEDSGIHSRAGFATRDLWVTRYAPDELYPAGDYVNQSPPGRGLPEFARRNRSIDGEDVVLWHTFGLTHFPRPEDWPVMPVDRCGFTLKPSGFFDRNPTLDVPPSAAGGHCHA
ncbi:primary-amine oxidase [Microbispora corallina]|uniref:Amine oxidase n=1 Tax=Microbispora corallina TaxID=83302 RepID=A0ABQ4FZD3_9ACTN|nr:primary-amine oxidase [Microbispora corallina]GIH40184.1 amine oxidase [Microbispora corallina]